MFTRERRSIRRFFANGTRNFSDRKTVKARTSREAIVDIARSGCDAALFATDAFDEASRVEVVAVVATMRTGGVRTLSRDFWQ